MTSKLVPLTDAQSAFTLVDAISARSRQLQSIFSTGFTTPEALQRVESLTGEIDEATRVLRRITKTRLKRAA